MKKLILPILLFLALVPSKAQLKIDKKEIEKSIEYNQSETKKSISKLEILSANEKIVVVNDSIFYTKEFKNLDTNKSYYFEMNFDVNDLINVEDLNEEGLKLDKAPYKVVTILNDNSKEEKEYQSNHQLDELFKRIRKKTNDDFKYFLNFLPSGNYTYNLFINQPLKVKSDFFNHLEKLMNDKGVYVANESLNQPKILLNDKQVSFDEVDKVQADQVKSISIYKDEESIALYGSSAKNGIVIIETK